MIMALLVQKRVLSVLTPAFLHCRCFRGFSTDEYSFCSSVANEDYTDNLYQWKLPSGYDTGIKITNSYRCLGRRSEKRKVPLIVNNRNHISWYACGPTVYDKSHIGHASSYIRFDAMRRILTDLLGFSVNLVMGITDIDDKIISRANLLEKEFFSMANHFEEEFKKDMQNFNILPPSMYVRVSDVIPQIILFIHELLQKGHAYATDTGNVWFNYDSSSKLGRLTPPFEEKEDIDFSPNRLDKNSSKDFALWKAAKAGEPYWEAPWGNGRPGWHIECSTIASLIFGNKLDIHSGAHDLLVPHHECEVLQSESYHECDQWVNYFLHSGHLVSSFSEHKMSKSLGNVVNIQDFLMDRTADDFRMLCLLHLWHENLMYDDNTLMNASRKVKAFKEFLTKCKQYTIGSLDGNVDSVKVSELLQQCQKDVYNCLLDDFNTQGALLNLEYLRKNVNSMFTSYIDFDEEWEPGSIVREPASLQSVYHYFTKIFAILGFTSLSAEGTSVEYEKMQRFALDEDTTRNSGHGYVNYHIDFLKELTDFRTSMRKIANKLKHDGSPYFKDVFRECDDVRSKVNAKGGDMKDTIEVK